MATQTADPASLLSLYRDLLTLRRTHPCLVEGDYMSIDAGPDLYAYRRSTADATVVVVLSFADEPRRLTLDEPAAGRVLIGTHGPAGGEVRLDGLELLPDQALVVELSGR